MKVVSILGSPRKNGTSARIAASFMDVARQSGAETKTHFLSGMKYGGCLGCNACKEKSERCVQKDDLTEVLGDLEDADVAVFAVPVYYWDVSGQFKCFFDRTWSLVKPDYITNPEPSRLAPGKRAVLILTQGDVEERHGDVAKRYGHFLRMYGYRLDVIRAAGLGMEADADVSECAARARELASEITA